MKEINKTVFVANDGKEFDSKNECLAHELKVYWTDKIYNTLRHADADEIYDWILQNTMGFKMFPTETIPKLPPMPAEAINSESPVKNVVIEPKVFVPSELLNVLKKLNGLPPYDTPSNLCRNDGYFAQSIRNNFSEAQIKAAQIQLRLLK